MQNRGPDGFQPVAGVYALIDPRTGRVMYIGQSIDIDYRYRQHCTNLRDINREKVEWIWDLGKRALRPQLKVLAECTWPESDEVESRLIREYKAKGQCELNKIIGGPDRKPNKFLTAHQDDWFHLARKIKYARDLLMEIQQDVFRLAGGPSESKIRGVITALDRCKSFFEHKLYELFPDWLDVARVFFGSDLGDDYVPNIDESKRKR
jgi:hypothetical protein